MISSVSNGPLTNEMNANYKNAMIACKLKITERSKPCVVELDKPPNGIEVIVNGLFSLTISKPISLFNEFKYQIRSASVLKSIYL